MLVKSDCIFNQSQWFKLSVIVGSYSDFESIKHDKDLMNARQQATIDKERKHMEDTIRRLQVTKIK